MPVISPGNLAGHSMLCPYNLICESPITPNLEPSF